MHINTQTTHNSSNRSGEWLTPDSKRQLLNSLQWPIYFINLVDNTKLPCYTLPTWKIWFQLSGLDNEIPQSVKIPVDGAVRFAIAFCWKAIYQLHSYDIYLDPKRWEFTKIDWHDDLTRCYRSVCDKILSALGTN